MITTANVKNGVNVDQLVETIGAVQQNPELAKFEFRAKNNWIDGGHCVSSIKSFYGVGQEDGQEVAPQEEGQEKAGGSKELLP